MCVIMCVINPLTYLLPTSCRAGPAPFPQRRPWFLLQPRGPSTSRTQPHAQARGQPPHLPAPPQADELLVLGSGSRAIGRGKRGQQHTRRVLLVLGLLQISA